MKHLTNLLLNQYLDQALNADDLHRVETHIKECSVCHARLEELQTLASELKDYREETLPRDLTSSILRELSEQRIRAVYRLLLFAQSAISVGVVVLLLTQFDQSRTFLNVIERSYTLWPVLFSPGSAIPWPTWSAINPGLTTLMDRFLSVTGSLARLNPLLRPGILFPKHGLSLLVIGLAVSLLWILGNTALLFRRTEVHK